MGCGASKGAEVAPTTLPNPPAAKTEFTPDNKPSPSAQQQQPQEDAAKAVEPPEPANRSEEVTRTGVAAFEDDTDTRLDKPAEESPLESLTVPGLPPPPSTPPAAAQKPLFQSSAGLNGIGGPAAADSSDMSYFPEQVSLRMGGGGSGGGSSGGGGAIPQAQNLAAGRRPSPPSGGFQAVTSFNSGREASVGGFQPVASFSGGRGTSGGGGGGGGGGLPSVPPGGVGGGGSFGFGFQAVPSTRQLNQQSYQQQQQQPQPQAQPSFLSVPSGRTQQPQPQPQSSVTSLPSLQSQPQPLSESGPGPVSDRDRGLRGSGSNFGAVGGGGGGSIGSAAAAAVAASDDPWSSLQSQYRIRDSAAVPKSPDVGRGGGGGGAVYGASGGASAGGSLRGVGGAASLRGGGVAAAEAGREVLVLGDDGDDDAFSGGHGMTLGSTMNRTARGSQGASLPAVKPGAQPKKGGWGSGELARAGDLMIGSEDDWLEKDRPPGAAAAAAGGGGGGGGGGPASPGVLSLAAQLPPPPGARQKPPVSAAAGAAAVVSYSSGKQRSKDFEDRDTGHKTVLKGPMVKPKGDDVLCEDIEDVDTLLEDEMERHGLSNRNLANKLATYEAQFPGDD